MFDPSWPFTGLRHISHSSSSRDRRELVTCVTDEIDLAAIVAHGGVTGVTLRILLAAKLVTYHFYVGISIKNLRSPLLQLVRTSSFFNLFSALGCVYFPIVQTHAYRGTTLYISVGRVATYLVYARRSLVALGNTVCVLMRFEVYSCSFFRSYRTFCCHNGCML